jgi:hypothetical protein
MNVAPGKQRGLIGATLLKAQFERSAYGCKLYCCWCAQDIAANRFWEAMGFVPLAFRTGSRGRGRVHIFWQRRIRSGDTTTPFWFPSQTTSGSIREDRLVLPIPPGTHWSDAKPLILPGDQPQTPALPAPRRSKPRIEKPVPKTGLAAGGIHIGPSIVPLPPSPVPVETKREPRKKQKNDPVMVAKARELRDRWLEQVNENQLEFQPAKYEISRLVNMTASDQMNLLPAQNPPARLLPAA